MIEIERATKKDTGFTIIEIVIVILLLSVVSVFVMSRFNDETAFTGLIVRDQLISQARRAQQGSFGRSGMAMVFTPNGGGTEATIEVLEGSAALSSITVSISSLTLTGDVDETSSCSSTAGTNITNANPFRLSFGELGDIVASTGVVGAASYGAVTSAARICIDEDVTYSICVSPSGFAYVGDCDA